MVILKFGLEVSVNQDLKRERVVIMFKNKAQKTNFLSERRVWFLILSKMFLSIILQKTLLMSGII